MCFSLNVYPALVRKRMVGRLLTTRSTGEGEIHFGGLPKGVRETEQRNVPMKVTTCTGEETSEAKVSRTKFTTKLMDMLREDHSGVGIRTIGRKS